MPDYASILKRSVSALPDPTPEMREAVYQRARAALARQLTAVDPPLTSREIEAQHQELEDAVMRIETEFIPPPPTPAQVATSYGAAAKDDFLFTPPAAPAPSPQPRRAQASPPPRDPMLDDVSDFADDDEDDDDYVDDDERGSRMPALIGLLVVILAVAGIAGYAYSQRDMVLGLLGLGADEGPAQTSSARVVTPDPVEDAGKQSDRLVNGSEPPPEPEEADTAMAPGASDEMAPSDAMEPVTGSQTTASLETEEPGTNLVGQRAIYYYQGADGQAGEASEGSATWSNVNRDGRPAIRAVLAIPGRDVEATVTIYKNYDSSLPASHLVEIQFSGDLAAAPIQRVPALVMKQTEQARGQPLAGAAVPVTNNLFWIALSDDQEQVTRNLQLLREGSWFDVPILFGDQTRALLTFEKGIPGDKVFEAVMASWTP